MVSGCVRTVTDLTLKVLSRQVVTVFEVQNHSNIVVNTFGQQTVSCSTLRTLQINKPKHAPTDIAFSGCNLLDVAEQRELMRPWLGGCHLICSFVVTLATNTCLPYLPHKQPALWLYSWLTVCEEMNCSCKMGGSVCVWGGLLCVYVGGSVCGGVADIALGGCVCGGVGGE